MAFDSEEPENARKIPWRRIFYGVGVIVALCAGLYFLTTSSFFIKGLILPRIERNLGAQIDVEDISISPFRWLRARGVSVAFEDSKTTFQTDALDLDANLLNLRSGDLRIDKLQLKNPVLHWVQGAEKNAVQETPGRSSSTTDYSRLLRHLDVGEILIENGSLQMKSEPGEATKKFWEGEQINIQLKNLRPGGAGDLSMAGNFRYEQSHPSGSGEENPPADRWSAQMNGKYKFTLDSSSLPQSVEGKTVIRLGEAEGRFADIQDLTAEMEANLTPKRLDGLSIVFSKGGQRLGRAQLNGPLDLDRRQAHLNLNVSELDRRVLNLLVAGRGWDFGSSRLSATGVLDFSRNGQFMVADVKINGNDLTLLTDGESIQPFGLGLDLQINGNLGEDTLLLRRFNCELSQAGNTVLNASLDRPMNLSLGQVYPGFKESSFTVKWNGLNLAHWKPFVGEYLSGGLSQGTVTLTAENDGRLVVFNGSAQMNDLTARLPGHSVDQAKAELSFDGRIEDFERFSVEHYRYQASRRNKPLVQGDGTIEYHRVFKDFRFRVTSNVQLPALLEAYPFENVSTAKGVLKSSWTYFNTRAGRELSGNLMIEDLGGEIYGVNLENFYANLDSRCEVHDNTLVIRDASLRTRRGLEDGGLIGLDGKIDLQDKSGELGLRLIAVNEKTLNPLLHRLERTFALNSISVSGGFNSAWDSNFKIAFHGDVDVTNLTVAASNPFGFGVNLEGELTNDRLRIPSLKLTLPGTKQIVDNHLDIQSTFDLSGTNTAMTNQIQIASKQVDVTDAVQFLTYMAMSDTFENAQPPTARKESVATTTALIPNFIANLNLKEAHFEELVLTNLVAEVDAEDGVVALQPLNTVLNQTPVTTKASIDLNSTPARYAFEFHGKQVPVEPIAKSLLSPQTSGTFDGAADLDVTLARPAATSASSSGLGGEISLRLADARISPGGPKLRNVIQPVAVLLQSPELLEYPISEVAGNLKIDNGLAKVNNLTAKSGLFQAGISGEIQLADNWSQSRLNLPVDLSLKRSIADKARLTPNNAPADQEFVPLPNFLRITGTLENPGSKISDVFQAAITGAKVLGVDSEELRKIEEPLQNVNDILNIFRTLDFKKQNQSPPAGSTNSPPRRN